MKNSEKVAKIEEHLESIMSLIGIVPTESNEDTPHRIAKMWVNELFANINDNNLEELKDSMTLFDNNYQSEMVIVKDIPFNSICEHHFLPFSGKVIIGYVPSSKIIGLSKLPRVVKYFSKRPQLQEKFNTEIGHFLKEALDPNALFIEVTAEHQCVKCRGAESDCSTTTYFKYTKKGFEDTYNEFLLRR